MLCSSYSLYLFSTDFYGNHSGRLTLFFTSSHFVMGLSNLAV
jgi:hypothetical protein